MKPYQTRKLTENPDVADCVFEGRKGAVGGKAYGTPKTKKISRRYFKRSDKARMAALIAVDNQ